MHKIQREDIHIISQHSDLSAPKIERALKENVYAQRGDWQKFLRLFFITLGVGFTVVGIIFFFAYNWDNLHKFVKLGLTQGIVIATTILALLPKISATLRNIILTGASVLVGVLFAVFGQIYQTGANAYDFFLAWTVFITLWVLVARFVPLWVVFLILVNTTIILYSEQVADNWSAAFICTILFALNTSVLITAKVLAARTNESTIPNWFLNTVALAAVSFATIGVVNGIWDSYEPYFLVLILLTASVFVLGIWHGLKTKSAFYLSIIPFSLIIIISAVLFEISSDQLTFLFVSVFIIGAVTLTIRNVINLQKKWRNEK